MAIACYSWGSYDKDDTFADFSNYGGDVDLIAPGKCIMSTIATGGYAYMSGTSMAAPTVTGAVALYKSSRPNATPAEVREALRYLGNLGWKYWTEPGSDARATARRVAHRPARDVRADPGRRDDADRRGRYDARPSRSRSPAARPSSSASAVGHIAARRLDQAPSPTPA